MRHVATDPDAHRGKVIGSGHCVPLVLTAAGVPHTSHWRRGERVRGLALDPGTIIATFNAEGRYANATDGSSHAAIFLGHEANGVRVLDQWVEPSGRRRPVAERTIRYKGGVGLAVDDADRYFVLET